MCGIEMLNVDHGFVERVYFLKCFGNGCTITSANASEPFGIANPKIKDCVFDTCVQGILPQYIVTGDAIQVNSTFGGEISGNLLLNTGGPGMDIQGSQGLSIHDNMFWGPGGVYPAGTPQASQQRNGIHSAFGCIGCTIHHNVFYFAGPILMNGEMAPSSNNSFVPTPGPTNCIISDNVFYGTTQNGLPAATPTFPATGVGVTNTTGFPMGAFVTLNGATITSVVVNGITYPALTGANNSQIGIPTGGTISFTYTGGPPTWSWFETPNLLAAPIQLSGGSTATALGHCAYNTIEGNAIYACPSTAIQTTDGLSNTIVGNVIHNCGDFIPAVAIRMLDSQAGVAGTGSKLSSISDNTIADDRPVKTLVANYGDNTANNTGNTIHNNRWESFTSLLPFVVSTPYNAVDMSYNYGPGRIANPIVPVSFVLAASGSPNTNPVPCDCTVSVINTTGATVVVAIGGSTISNSPNSNGAVQNFKLRAGENFTVTYPAAPTINFFTV
jgi:hypothetical protein